MFIQQIMELIFRAFNVENKSSDKGGVPRHNQANSANLFITN